MFEIGCCNECKFNRIYNPNICPFVFECVIAVHALEAYHILVFSYRLVERHLLCGKNAKHCWHGEMGKYPTNYMAASLHPHNSLWDYSLHQLVVIVELDSALAQLQFKFGLHVWSVFR